MANTLGPEDRISIEVWHFAIPQKGQSSEGERGKGVEETRLRLERELHDISE